MNISKKLKARRERKKSIRKKISGSGKRPRIVIYRGNNNLFAQMVDDSAGRTIVSASTLDKDLKGKNTKKNMDGAKALGMALGEKAVEKGIKTAVFDRNGYTYHGRVKAFADAIREKGIKF